MANQIIINVGDDLYKSDFDSRVYQPVKRQRCNPVGEDIYLFPDSSITRDEDKIINIQRIFMGNYYKPDGRGAKRALSKYM